MKAVLQYSQLVDLKHPIANTTVEKMIHELTYIGANLDQVFSLLSFIVDLFSLQAVGEKPYIAAENIPPNISHPLNRKIIVKSTTPTRVSPPKNRATSIQRSRSKRNKTPSIAFHIPNNNTLHNPHPHSDPSIPIRTQAVVKQNPR